MLRSSHRLGFVFHQLCEYGLALLLFAMGAHLSGGARLLSLASAGAITLLNLLSQGPLGLASVLSRRAHHVADLALVLGLLIAPIACSGRVGLSGIAVGLLVAALLLVLERSSSYVLAPARPARALASSSLAQLGPISALVVRRSARGLGRASGVARKIARERSAARRAGGGL